jgi:hypothetical protein
MVVTVQVDPLAGDEGGKLIAADAPWNDQSACVQVCAVYVLPGA